MRRIVALFLTVVLGGVGLVLVASPASAATITTPTGDPFVVPGDAGGNPQPFTVSASGYSPGSNVFIEQCDGTSSTAVGWDPTINCDLGASPAAVIADAGGVVTFPAADPNFGFRPFKGVSPQGIFNCLAPGQASPANGLPDFTNCQFRVSSNNSAATADQVFRTMTLPAGAATSAPNFTGTPTAGTVGSPYSFAFTGITGSPTPTFALSPTPVAGGITISAAGALSGTPTTAGSFPITVTASNGIAPNAVKTFTLVINPATSAPDFTGTPTAGTVGVAYSFAFTGITGSPTPTFALSPTPVAGGITISAAGALSGTPTTAGSFPITVTASNGIAPNAVKTFTLVIAPVTTAPNFTGTPNGGTVGVAYSFAFTGITGAPAPTFALSPTPVAGGITISAAGVLSGTPTTAGSFPITVTAANGVAPDAVKTFTLVIAPANTDVPPDFAGTPTGGTVGVAYSFAFTGITGSPAPTFALSPTPVAGGITISAAGGLSGTPTTAGSFPITVTAANGVAPDAVKTFTLVIAPANTDVPPDFAGTPTGGTVGVAYSFAFTGITGSPAPTFALSPTPVAGGITISAAGGLSGTPTTAGSFPITVTAANGVAPNAVKTFTLVIAPANTDVPPDFAGTPTGGTVGSPYSFAFTGITGSPAPTFALDPATVAGGITISAAGVLSGTPTTAGSFPITVTASNGVAPDAVKTFTLEVAPPTTGTAPDFSGRPDRARVGKAYSFAFTVTAGSPAPTFTLDRETVAGGITISPEGVLSGTPTKWGWFRIKVTASNGVDPDAVKIFWLKVEPKHCHGHHGHHGHRSWWFWFAGHHGDNDHHGSWRHCHHHRDRRDCDHDRDHHDRDHHDRDHDDDRSKKS